MCVCPHQGIFLLYMYGTYHTHTSMVWTVVLYVYGRITINMDVVMVRYTMAFHTACMDLANFTTS